MHIDSSGFRFAALAVLSLLICSLSATTIPVTADDGNGQDFKYVVRVQRALAELGLSPTLSDERACSFWEHFNPCVVRAVKGHAPSDKTFVPGEISTVIQLYVYPDEGLAASNYRMELKSDVSAYRNRLDFQNLTTQTYSAFLRVH